MEFIDVNINELFQSVIDAYQADAEEKVPNLQFYNLESEESKIPEGIDGSLFEDEFGKEVLEMQYVSEYAMAVSTSKNVFEVDILKTDSEHIEDIKNLLSKRLAVINSGDILVYTPGEQPIIDNAIIFSAGNFVILAATYDNSIANDIINNAVNIKSEEESEETTAAVIVRTLPSSVQNAVSQINVDMSFFAEQAEKDAKPAVVTNPNVDPANMSEVPVITFAYHLENNVIVLGGTCAADAVIHFRGTNNIKEKTYTPDYNRFDGTVEINEGITTIYVTAEQTGKAESVAIEIVVRPRVDVDIRERHGSTAVIVGNDYQHFIYDVVNDYTGANLLSQSQIDMIKKNIKAKVDFLKSGDLNAELIYVVAPNSMTVHPEHVPDTFVQYQGETRREQFVKLAREAGAYVIDAADALIEHKNDDIKVFNKTDTHWSLYGAYLAYEQLSAHVAESYPEVTVHPLTDFDFYVKEVGGGDIADLMEVDPNKLKENATFVNYLWDIKNDPEIFKTDRIQENTGTGVGDTTTQLQTLTNGRSGNQPKAMILRDSFGAQTFAMFSDLFSESYMQAMWDYTFNNNAIKSFNPQYYIYVITERNLAAVF
jgi:hypothetical protein